jgi:hypothetical protein
VQLQEDGSPVLKLGDIVPICSDKFRARGAEPRPGGIAARRFFLHLCLELAGGVIYSGVPIPLPSPSDNALAAAIASEDEFNAR